MTDSESNGIPGWVPPSLRHVVGLPEPGERRLRVRTHALTPGNVAFDEVPDGWTIDVQGAGQRVTSITCGQPGDGLVWILSEVAHRQVTLGPGLSNVHISGRKTSGSQVFLSLGGADMSLTLHGGGAYTISGTGPDGPFPYDVHVKLDEPGRRTTRRASPPDFTLSGDARLRKLTGAGSLKLDMSVQDAKLAVTGAVTASDLIRTAIGVATTSTAGDQPTLAVTVSGSAQACTFTGPMSVIVAKVSGGISASGISSLTVKRNCTGRIEIYASKVELESMRGHGSVHCDSFSATGDVKAEDGHLRIATKQSLIVDGTVDGTTLSCCGSPDSAIRVGRRRPTENLTITEHEVSRDTVRPATVAPSSGFTDRVPLQRCVLVSGGNVEIFGSVTSSLLQVAGRLVVAVDLDCRESDINLLGPEISEPIDGRLAEVTQERPCSVGEMIVGNQVRLNADQEISIEKGFSSNTLEGGVVSVGDNADGYVVAGSAGSARIVAGRLGLAEAPNRCELRSATLLNLTKGAPSECVLYFSGDGFFGGPVQSELTWRPDGPHQCEIPHGATKIEVVAPPDGKNAAPILVIGRDDPAQELRLTGALDLRMTEPTQRRLGKPDVVQAWKTATLNTNALLNVDTVGVDIGGLVVAANAGVTRKSTDNGEVVLWIVPGDGRHELALHPGGGIRVDPPREMCAGAPDGSDLPTLRITGGETHINTVLGKVICVPADDETVPVLHVPTDGTVTSLAGQFYLGQLHGRINSDRVNGYEMKARSRAEARCKQLARRLTGARFGVADTSGRDASPAQLRGVTPEVARAKIDEEDHLLRGGQLIGVDVAQLPFIAIPALSQLHVFEPDGESLLDHACDPEPDRRERAQRLRLVAEKVSPRANSGATRSAVLWSAARAQHAAVGARHWVEKTTRLLHRSLGYGYRPWPAAITYAAWLLSFSTLLTLVEPLPDCAKPGSTEFLEGPYSFRQQFVRVFLLPVTLLRLEGGGALTYAPIGCHVALHTVAFAVTGFLLAFLAIAVRNYLRSRPHG